MACMLGSKTRTVLRCRHDSVCCLLRQHGVGWLQAVELRAAVRSQPAGDMPWQHLCTYTRCMKGIDVERSWAGET